MRLEVGSGYFPAEGFVHLDANPNAPHVEIIGDAAGPIDLDDGTVDELRAVDVLEHISYRRTDAALAEWARVLKPGGKLYVQVPDAGVAISWFTGDPDMLLARAVVFDEPINALAWILLGGHDDGISVHDGDDWRHNAHYSLWTRGSLHHALLRAGFVVESCETNTHPNLMCWAVKR